MASNVEKLRRLAGEMKGGASFYSWKSGKNRLIFLPTIQDDEVFFLVYAQHWVDDPTGDDSPALTTFCKKRGPFYEKTCMGCKLTRMAFDYAGKDAGKRVAASPRAYANVIDADNIGAGVQVINLSKAVVNQLVALVEDGFDVADPDGATIVIIRKEGEGLGTKYTVTPTRKEIPLEKLSAKMEGDDDVMARRHDLNALVVAESEIEERRFAQTVALAYPQTAEAIAELGIAPAKQLSGGSARDIDWGDDGKAVEVEVVDAEVIDTPECFGVEYEEGDETCEECDLYKACGAKFNAPSKSGKVRKKKSTSMDDLDALLAD